MTDNDLISAMFDKDRDFAQIAKRLFSKRHAGDSVAEPPHCDQCFEGCDKCQPRMPCPTCQHSLAECVKEDRIEMPRHTEILMRCPLCGARHRAIYSAAGQFR